MPEGDDSKGSIVFTEIETTDSPSNRAKQEADQLERPPAELPPNSVTLNFGKVCQIRWHAESSAPLFCFLSIVILLIFGLVLAAISATNSGMHWPGEVFKFLGQAILTLVGAVVGASAVGGSSVRSRKNGSRN